MKRRSFLRVLLALPAGLLVGAGLMRRRVDEPFVQRISPREFHWSSDLNTVPHYVGFDALDISPQSEDRETFIR